MDAITRYLEKIFSQRRAQLLLLGALIVTFLTINLIVVYQLNRQLRQAVREEMIFRSRVTGESVSHFFSGKIHTVLLLEKYRPIREYGVVGMDIFLTTVSAIMEKSHTGLAEAVEKWKHQKNEFAV